MILKCEYRKIKIRWCWELNWTLKRIHVSSTQYFFVHIIAPHVFSVPFTKDDKKVIEKEAKKLGKKLPMQISVAFEFDA